VGERRGPLTVTVIVPARDAADTIEATLEGLAAQTDAPPFEVIVVDSGSSDGTPVIAAIAGAKVLHNDGGEPAGSRNMGAALAFGDVLAFTDADCAPEPGWLAAGVAALEHGVDLVQGSVAPIRGAWPYDRTVSVGGEHGLYETASLFVRREAFERIGGFEPVPGLGIGTGQPFGEDAWFAWRLKRAGARSMFAADARVCHEVFARGPGGWIWERRRTSLFPPLVALIPELRSSFLHGRWFLSAASFKFDLAIAGGVLAALTAGRTRRPAAVLLLAFAAPYAADVGSDTRSRGAAPTYPLARVAADALTFAALVAGSIRSRTAVL
jgi:glycosyltransferase involved in cell wall biosynthesis